MCHLEGPDHIAPNTVNVNCPINRERATTLSRCTVDSNTVRREIKRVHIRWIHALDLSYMLLRRSALHTHTHYDEVCEMSIGVPSSCKVTTTTTTTNITRTTIKMRKASKKIIVTMMIMMMVTMVQATTTKSATNDMTELHIQMNRDAETGEKKPATKGGKQEVEELRRAFSELLKEKRELTQVVREDQKHLEELQKKIQNPTLGEWLRKRAIRGAQLLDVPEAEALGYYAKLYMKPKLGKARDGLFALEKQVEAGVDSVIPAKYGTQIAILLTAALVGFPTLIVFKLAIRLSRTLSIAQYVLLINVFLSALTTGLIIARLLLGQDPLQTLYESAEHLFMATQLLLCFFYVGFMILLMISVFRYRSRKRLIFILEFVFYWLIGSNYRRRVWQPVMLGEVIHSNFIMYSIYLVDFVCMTLLTIRAADRGSRGGGGDGGGILPTSKRGGYDDNGTKRN